MAEEDPAQEDAATAVLTASRALLAVVARSLAPALEKVTLPQFRVLVILSSEPGPVRSGEVAAAVGVHPSTFSRNADRLVAGGWVQRRPNPESRRETLIGLTPKGARLVALVTRRRRTEIREILNRMTRHDRDLVRAGLAVFAATTGEPSVDDLAELAL